IRGLARKAETARGVLPVADDEIEGEPLTKCRQLACNNIPSGPSNNVADKQDPHSLFQMPQRRRAAGGRVRRDRARWGIKRTGPPPPLDSDPHGPASAGGRHMSEATAPVRDSSR